MRKSLQFGVLFVQAFVSRHRKALLLSALVGFLSTLLILQLAPSLYKLAEERQKRIAVVGVFTESTLPLSIQNQISFGLTKLTQSGDVTPSLAESWDVDPQGTTYTFHLKKNVRWHDGKELSALDISYKLKGATFTVVDPSTIRVTLKEPYAPLLTILAKPLIRPGLLGLGPYKVTHIHETEDLVQGMTLEPLVPNLDPVIYRFYPNIAEGILAFKLGEVDSIQDLPDTADLTSWKSVHISVATQYDKYAAVFFNFNDQYFKEKEIRQALAYAVPQFSDMEKSHGPLSPYSWAYSTKIRLYNFDPESARKILSKSPLATSNDVIILSTFPSLLPQAQAIVDAWQKVGVRAKVKVEQSVPSSYQVLLAVQTIPDDPDQYASWQSTQIETNITGYSNPKIDKLLEDGRKTLDQSARKKIYADFQRYLIDDCPAIFLYYPKSYTIERV